MVDMLGIPSLNVILVILVTLFSLIIASPSVPLLLLEARQKGFCVVKGVTDGGVQPRLNIRDLASKSENRDMWTLFLLALNRFQKDSQQKKTSYFQVAGIHGQPWIAWDNVEGWSSNPEWGYCPHGGNLFATWHRPYLLLFEQILNTYAVAVVNDISNSGTKARFREAASKLRLPYWDWAQSLNNNEHVLPDAIANDKITFTCPNGTITTINNPLRAYTFNPLVPEDFPVPDVIPYNKWKRTMRYPEPEESPNAKDNFKNMHASLDGLLTNLRDGVWSFFKSYQTFDQFSNMGSNYDPAIGNLETVHGNIHNAFFLGHMWFSRVASFDPVFWLHHANVDRQLAMWQVLYPNTYVTSTRNRYQQTFTLNGATKTGPNTPLHPFHRNSNGDFWTSALVRDIKKLGYTYPELVGNPSNETLIATIKRLYSDELTSLVIAPSGRTKLSSTTRDYKALITLPTGYTVYVFLGKPGTDPTLWPADANFAGSFSTTFNLGMGRNNQTIKGVVSLTKQIVQEARQGVLDITSESKVVEHLRKVLVTKITNANGDEVVSTGISGFQMEVFSQLESLPTSAGKFPVILETKKYGNLTRLGLIS